jgi:hypothetical protein
MDSVTRVSIAHWGLMAQTAAWIRLQNLRAVVSITIPLTTVILAAVAPMAAVAVVTQLAAVSLGHVVVAAAVVPLAVAMILLYHEITIETVVTADHPFYGRERLSVMRLTLAMEVLRCQNGVVQSGLLIANTRTSPAVTGLSGVRVGRLSVWNLRSFTLSKDSILLACLTCQMRLGPLAERTRAGVLVDTTTYS